MCRNIRTLYNYDPPVSHEDIHAASLQFVRKVSGFKKPSQINEMAFEEAVLQITRASEKLIASLTTTAPRRNREIEIAKAREKSIKRFGKF